MAAAHRFDLCWLDVSHRKALEKMAEPDMLRILNEARSLVRFLEARLGFRDSDGNAIHPIVRWRKIRGLTQGELAARVGISGAALHRIEHLPGFAGKETTRARIAAALDVSQEALRAPATVVRPDPPPLYDELPASKAADAVAPPKKLGRRANPRLLRARIRARR